MSDTNSPEIPSALGERLRVVLAEPGTVSAVSSENVSIKEALPFMRQITDHMVKGSSTDDCIALCTVDLPGAGGANHHYQIVGMNPMDGADELPAFCVNINFQNGPIGEKGINGVTNEVLAAVIIDRLLGFQHPRNGKPEDGRGHYLLDESGQYACPENAAALAHFQEGLKWLKRRTSLRLARGVEGTSKV
jgi:hypothetical protein